MVEKICGKVSFEKVSETPPIFSAYGPSRPVAAVAYAGPYRSPTG